MLRALTGQHTGDPIGHLRDPHCMHEAGDLKARACVQRSINQGWEYARAPLIGDQLYACGFQLSRKVTVRLNTPLDLLSLQK